MADVVLEKVVKHYPGNKKPTVRAMDLSIDDGEFMVFVIVAIISTVFASVAISIGLSFIGR